MNEKCELLSAEIEKHFRQGIVLDKEVYHFLNSTFSDPTPSELEEILNDISNPEKDSFLELIFFPDEILQTKVENILSSEPFQKQDEYDVIDYLALTKPEVTIFIPGFEKPFELRMPGWVAEALVSRLRICKRIDQRLVEAVLENISADDRNAVKVRLRNTDFCENINRIDFLLNLFRDHAKDHSKFFKHLDFILEFFTETEPDSDVFHELNKKKEKYEENIGKALKFKEQLKKSNIETMMMMGKRNPSINIDELKEKIDIINYLQTLSCTVQEGSKSFEHKRHGKKNG